MRVFESVGFLWYYEYMINLDISLLSDIYGSDIPSACKEKDIIRSFLADDLKKSLRSGVISRILFEQLLNLPDTGFRMAPQWVTEEINNLEFNLPSRTKPEDSFRNPILRNLYHKHFFIPTLNLGKNVFNCIQSEKFKKILQAHSHDLEENYSEQKLRQYCADISQEVIDASTETETGNWLIYTKYNNKNYYLCIYPHPEGRSEDCKIKELCQKAAQVFPELKNFLV